MRFRSSSNLRNKPRLPMSDKTKTKQQLTEELEKLRQQISAQPSASPVPPPAEPSRAQERDLLDALMDNMPDHIFFKDAQSRFIRTNPAHTRALGLGDPNEATGKTDFDLFDSKDAQKYYDEEQRIMRSGEAVIARMWSTRYSTGEELWLSENKIPFRDRSGRVVGLVGISRDITALKRAEAMVERRALQLQTAAEVSRATSSILNLDELLPQAVELIRERFNLYYAGLFLADETGQWLVLRAGTGEAGRQMRGLGHKVQRTGASAMAWSVANKKARTVFDVGPEAASFNDPLLPRTRSELVLPLISRGEVIGAMTVHSEKESAFSPED